MLSESYCEYYMNNESFECAQMAAGSAIELTKAILDNKVQNGLALIRPPGHHAMKGECNGFCIFNNVAIAGKLKYAAFFFFLRHRISKDHKLRFINKRIVEGFFSGSARLGQKLLRP